MNFLILKKELFVGFVFLISACFLVSAASTSVAPQQGLQENCLTLHEILSLLEKGIEQKVIIEKVEKYGADLKLDTEACSKLIHAGAGIDMLKAIENHSCAVLLITFPENGAECGPTTRVMGKSKKFPGKYLWVFAHSEILIDKWWPQIGTVNVNSDGEWGTMANLGQPQDVGFNFEIVALWVDASTQQMLNDYLSKCDQIEKYPGIPLPNGSPSAKVVVKKIK